MSEWLDALWMFVKFAACICAIPFVVGCLVSLIPEPAPEPAPEHKTPKPRGAYVKRQDYSPRRIAHQYDIRLGEPVKQGRGADVMIEDTGYMTFDEMLADDN